MTADAEEDMMTNAIEVRSLVVRRGHHEVLRDLTFEVPQGQVTGLLGPSGCGKSTLMRSVVGVQRITSGEVLVAGLPAGAKALRHRIGYVTQSPSVYGDLTVEQNLRFYARVLGVPRGRVDEVVDTVDLGAQVEQGVDQLSGGQRSRVSLGVALLGKPDVLILDEPTVGLDPVLREDLWETFRTLAADGAAVLVSSHVMDEADRCDRLLLMREGRIVADDTPAGLRTRTGADSIEDAFLRLIREEAA